MQLFVSSLAVIQAFIIAYFVIMLFNYNSKINKFYCFLTVFLTLCIYRYFLESVHTAQLIITIIFAVILTIVIYFFTKDAIKQILLYVEIIFTITVISEDITSVILILAGFSRPEITNGILVLVTTRLLSSLLIAIFAYCMFRIKSYLNDLVTTSINTYLIIIFLLFIELKLIQGIIFNAYNQADLLLIIIILSIRFILLIRLLIKQKKEVINDYEYRLLNYSLDTLSQQFNSIEQETSELHKFKHDVTHLIGYIKANLNNQNYDAINTELNEFDKKLSASITPCITDNTAIDSVITSKLLQCKQLNIDLRYTIDITDLSSFDSMHLSLLILNVLDNAIQHIDVTDKLIELSIRSRNGFLTITVISTANTSQSETFDDTLSPCFMSIAMIVKQYNGDYHIHQINNKLISKINIEIPTLKEDKT